MALTSQVALHVAGEYTSALDVGTVSYPINFNAVYNLANGTGANQANEIFTDTRTLTASSSESIDLAGVLANAIGSTLTFSKVKALIVTAASGNTNDVLVGGAASNQVASLFGDVSDVVKVKPGGMMALVAPDNTGYAVTASTGDILKVANSSSGTSVTYTIIVIGVV